MESSFVVCLKLYRLIAAKFIFYPSKVSINFTVCCLSIAMAFDFLLDTQQCQCSEQPLLQLQLMAADCVPASQAAALIQKEGRGG